MKEVIVVGAGISGLATAFEIREKAKAAGEKAAVTVLEKGSRPGGKMHTELIGGYVCEWGPNGYLDSKVHATEFCERAGLRKELVPASNVVNRRFLFAKGKMRELPDSPPKFFLSGLLSLPGRIRVAFEPLIRPARRGVDESVTEFATRRMGREALEMLLDPFVAGVFAGNPDTLSLKSCFPRIHEMEQTYGSLVKALFALRKKRKAEKKKAKTEGKSVAGATAPRGHLTSLRRGMGQLTDWLAKGLGSSLVLDDVNLTLDNHEVVCLIGASGSGKSTLLRCINDLVPFDAGVVRLDGISIHDPQLERSELYKRIGIVFQAMYDLKYLYHWQNCRQFLPSHLM